MRAARPSVLTLLIAGGCAAPRVNPSFPVSLVEARKDWVRMCQDPCPAPRPVVVVGGYCDPGLAAGDVATRLRRALGPQSRVVAVEVGLCLSMNDARDKLLRHVRTSADSTGGAADRAVDVVAVSMGGLVARFAALPRGEDAGLKIGRLFTISSPHSGARLAAVPSLESRVRDMRRGSEFLRRLNAASPSFDLIPYARLNDWIVGEENAAPPEMLPWWVDTPKFETAHLQAHTDARILADIARRLRGETPLTLEPRSPIPQ